MRRVGCCSAVRRARMDSASTDEARSSTDIRAIALLRGSMCSVSCGVNESQTKAVIDALLNRMCHYIEIGHPVKMGEFGSFNPVINVKCVKTEEEATSETIQKKRILFIPGKRLRQTMADLTIKTAGDALND